MDNRSVGFMDILKHLLHCACERCGILILCSHVCQVLSVFGWVRPVLRNADDLDLDANCYRCMDGFEFEDFKTRD